MDALGLDARVARAAAKRGYAVPTPVQAQAIPLALAGKVRLPKADSTLAAAGRAARAPRHRSPHAPQRSTSPAAHPAWLTRALPLRVACIAAQDVIAQAVTGSGKTAAYLLPALHRLLTQAAEAAPPPRALVLVPTRELCTQARPPPSVSALPCFVSPLHRAGSRRGCCARRRSGRHAACGAAAARGRAGSSARRSSSRSSGLACRHAGACGAGAAGGAVPPGRHHARPAAPRCAPPAGRNAKAKRDLAAAAPALCLCSRRFLFATRSA
jgi:hypothetical protein